MKNNVRQLLHVGAAASILLSTSGCDESFHPKGLFQEQLVLYSVLSTRSDSQFVRVYTTYNPSGHNPLENNSDTQLRNARVTLTIDSSTITLGSVTIPRSDLSRYHDDIAAYMIYPHRLRPGAAYTLNVSSEKGSAQAVLTVPARGEIAANNPFVLKEPEKYNEDISVRLRLSPAAQGYMARIILEFETRLGNQVSRHREEIPSSVISRGGLSFKYEYPMVKRRESNTFVRYQIEYFKLDAYKVFLSGLITRYGVITISGATYILTQVDRGLYTYYNLVNGFQDPFSIRTDLPDYTSIQGGRGVFGAMVDDSSHVDLR